MVPLGQRLFADCNPVRTGGPMQVSVDVRRGARASRRPIRIRSTARSATRCSPAAAGVLRHRPPARLPGRLRPLLYRFADFNAGRYASRNAAFQNAVEHRVGHPARARRRPDRATTATRRAGQRPSSPRARSAARLDLSDAQIRRALEQGERADFEQTALYQRVFALAEQIAAARRCRARWCRDPAAKPEDHAQAHHRVVRDARRPAPPRCLAKASAGDPRKTLRSR